MCTPVSSPACPRVVLAHDWLVGMRGGERVLERIAIALKEDFEVRTLLTMVDNGRPHCPAIDELAHVRSVLQRVGGAGGARRWMLPLYPAAVAGLTRTLARLHARSPMDLLVSSSSAAVKSIRTPTGVPHLCYCHAPARYVWSQRAAYAGGSHASLRSLGLRAVGPWYRTWDRRTAVRVTRFLANSSHTADQIRRFYGREAHVLHPPVRTEFFTPDAGIERGDDWLLVSALEPYKRVDLAIRAAANANARLLVVGDGSQRESLEREATGRVEFLGRVDDERLRDLYRRARLLLFPQVEDFGIIAVEALACGCPVVARRAGGALDFLLMDAESDPGPRGAFFDEPRPEAIERAVQQVRQHDPRAQTKACRASAERFSEAAFDAELLRHVRELL